MKILKSFSCICGAAVLCALLGCASSSSSTAGQGSTSGGGTSSAALTVSAVSPSSVAAGAAATLTVTGTGFTTTTAVQVNGTALPTTFVSSTQVTASIAAGQFATAGMVTVSVSDKGVTAAGTTASLEVDNPLPAITGINPASAIVGSGATNVTVAGTGFISSTTVNVNGTARPTTYTSATQVVVALTASDLATTGSLSLTAVNPTPGGGVSAPATFTAVNPAPTAGAVNPSSVDGGSITNTLLTVSGSNFVPSSVVRIDGTARATTYVSSTTLNAALTPADQASARTLPVVVVTPAPGGGTSAAVSVTINVNPQPVLSSVSPSSIVAGSPVVLHVLGSGFISTSAILWNGSPLTTQVVSATELTATIGAGQSATAGTATITVKNPPPVGGQSGPFSLPINSAVPTLASVSPAVVFHSSTSTTFTLTGTGFQPTSTVIWNGKAYATTFVSSTQLSITVQQADVPATSTVAILVSTPAPGGGNSAALSIPVYAFKPVITDVRYTVGGGLCQQISLTVIGQYLPTSGVIVKLNGTAINSVTSAGSTQLRVTLPQTATAIPNPQITVEFGYVDGDISDPFPLSPISAVCITPSTVVSYPGTTIGLNVSATVLGTATAPVLSAVTLPAGFSATAPAPYSIPSRFYVMTGSSVAAGNYTFAVTGTGTTAYAPNIPVVVKTNAPSFNFAIPLTSEAVVQPGSSTSFTLTPYASDSSGTPDFLIDLAATGLPQGVTASFQPAKALPGDTVTVTLTAAKNAPFRQNVPISIIGTVDGGTGSASVAYTLDVSPAPGTIPDNRASFTATGATPVSIAYDRVHNLIFASNPTWNRIDVISNQTHAIVQSIPIASPAAIDLSQDSDTLWIGTKSQQVFALNTSTFLMRKYLVPLGFASNVLYPYWTDNELYALSNGNLLLVVTTNAAGPALVWSPATGTATPVNMGAGLVRSRDGSKVFGLTSSFSGCQLNVYSAASSSLNNYSIDSGFTGSAYCGSIMAANNDGSILVTNLSAASLRGVQLINATGQSLGNFTAALTPGGLSTNENVNFFPQTFVFSDDGRTLYQTGSLTGRGNLVATYDVTSRNLLGLAPALTSTTTPQSSGYGGNTILAAADATGLIIGIQNFGVAFEDSTYFQDYGTGTSTLSDPSLTAFSPQSGPLSGGTNFYPYGYVSIQPDAWLNDVRATTQLSSNSLTITSPPGLMAGPANVKAIYPNGEMGFAADAFSYGPFPQNMVYNGSSPLGGALATVTGFGLPVDSSSGSVSVGGNGATITSTVGQYPPWTGEAVPSTYLKFTMPAGKPGYADLQVQTPNGTGALPRAVFYAASVTDYSFTGTASALVYDKFRKRTYMIQKDSVLVFAADGGGFQSPIAVPTVNNILDLRDGALSTDGNYLLVGNIGDGSVAVLNLSTPASSYALAIPELSSTSSTCTIGPGSVTALSAGRAFILPVGSTTQCGFISKVATIDIQMRTRTILPSPGAYCDEAFFSAQAQGSADGTQIVLKTGNNGSTCLYSPTSGFSVNYGYTAFLTAGIAPDGNLLSGDTNLFNTSSQPVSSLAQPPALFGTALIQTFPADSRTVTLRGTHFNASGGLQYVPHAGYFDIVETMSDRLRMRFSLTQTLMDVTQPLAIDEGGRLVFLLTDAGLTVVDMGEAPLSVGHLGATQPVSGGTIQLRGSGFDTNTKVTVDGAAAVATLVDENTLTLSLPTLSTGPHDMTLTRGDGSTLTVKGLITVP